MTDSRLIELALNTGATKATVIATEDIVLDIRFRDTCLTNGCGMVGKCWMCPPDVGPAEPLMNMVKSFKKALLFQTITELEDSYDFEGMTEAGLKNAKLCANIRKEIGKLFDNKTVVLGSGGCRLCERCTRLDNLPCRQPDEALMSLEVCCIDVYKTVKPTELKYINGADTVTFFGMVLYN